MPVWYMPDVWRERIRTGGPPLLPPDAAGIGFDDLLEGLPWIKIG